MKLSEAASSHLAHRVLAALKENGAKIRSDRIALARIKETLARQVDRIPSEGQRAR
jgi:uncharacterized protein YpuA (DUF1002 family)